MSKLRVPVSDSTVFEIGSISKQFVATAVMLLMEDGRLGLDEVPQDVDIRGEGVRLDVALAGLGGVHADQSRALAQVGEERATRVPRANVGIRPRAHGNDP